MQSQNACVHVIVSQGEKGVAGEPGADGQNGLPVSLPPEPS